MKKRHVAGVAAGIVAAGIFLDTHQGLVLESVSDPSAPIQENQRVEVEHTFADLERYWATQHVGIGAVKLTWLENNNSYTCPAEDKLRADTITSKSGPGFCFPHNEIIMTQDLMAFANSASSIPFMHVDSSAVRIIATAHEVGHAVQEAKGDGTVQERENNLEQVELGADCYAGQALQQVNPTAVSEAPSVYKLFGEISLSDQSHGTTQDRIEAFTRGATTAQC